MAFARTHRTLFAGLTAVTGSCLVAAAVVAPSAGAVGHPDAARLSTPAELTAVGGTATSPELLTAPAGRPVARPQGLAASASDATVARAHLQSVAGRFGVSADSSSLRTTTTSETPGLGSVVRFAQLVDGVPVYGAELVVALDESGDLVSVGGETVPDTQLDFPVTAAQATDVAVAAGAKKLKVSDRRLRASAPTKLAYDPALIGDAGSGVRSVWRVVVTGARGSSVRADVFVDATDASVVSVSGSTESINRAVCDAETTGNASTSNGSGTTAAWQADGAYGWCGEDATDIVRDTNNDGYVVTPLTRAWYGLPDWWPADAYQPVRVPITRTEITGSGSTDVTTAFGALGDASTFYQSVLGYDLTAKIGATDDTVGNPSVTPNLRRLAGIVNYCEPAEFYYDYLETVPTDWHQAGADAAKADCFGDAKHAPGYENAYWADAVGNWMLSSGAAYPGGQMFIGKGLANSLDVIGHELTHGVTAATNDLIYRNESGAINESMSDVFGQLVQEYKTPGTDAQWLIGDQLSTPGLPGPIRSMSNPSTTALTGDSDGQPDKMTSALWDRDPLDYDAGGVHANSGVGNKAAWLIAHGGSFNGVNVARLGSSAADSTALTTKVAKLYWQTQRLLPSNANYRTLGTTLVAACNQLVGTDGFSAGDCSGSVAAAVAATEMTASSMSLTVSRTSVKPGQTAVVTARVTDTRGGATGAVAVKLQKLVGGTSKWVDAAGLSATNGSGVKAWTVRPDRTTTYRAQYPAGGIFRGSTSAARAVALTPTISKKASAKKIKYKKSFKVTGKVAPKLKGKTVYLQRYSSGKWRTVKKDKLSGKSLYSLTFKPTSRADRSFRVYLPKSAAYRSAVSAKFKVTVK